MHLPHLELMLLQQPLQFPRHQHVVGYVLSVEPLVGKPSGRSPRAKSDGDKFATCAEHAPQFADQFCRARSPLQRCADKGSIERLLRKGEGRPIAHHRLCPPAARRFYHLRRLIDTDYLVIPGGDPNRARARPATDIEDLQRSRAQVGSQERQDLRAGTRAKLVVMVRVPLRGPEQGPPQLLNRRMPKGCPENRTPLRLCL